MQKVTASVVDLYCGMHKVWLLAKYAAITIGKITISGETVTSYNSNAQTQRCLAIVPFTSSNSVPITSSNSNAQNQSYQAIVPFTSSNSKAKKSKSKKKKKKAKKSNSKREKKKGKNFKCIACM